MEAQEEDRVRPGIKYYKRRQSELPPPEVVASGSSIGTFIGALR
jgi:hypothetical protein